MPAVLVSDSHAAAVRAAVRPLPGRDASGWQGVVAAVGAVDDRRRRAARRRADSPVLSGPPRLMVPTDTVVSILIPVRNEGLNLTIMLKILKAVVDVPHEVLVVYDHPGDSSVDVVDPMAARYPTIRAVHNTVGPGILNALRAGVAESR